MSVTEGLGAMLDFLLPRPCLECGAAIDGDGPGLGLCRRCHGRLARAPRDACDGCGRRLGAPEARRCAGCRARSLPYERLHAAWLYRPPLDAVVHALKFHRLAYLGDELGRALAASLREVDGVDADLVVPLPLHWLRRLRRGFDQAERIARPLAAALDLPCADGLRRRRPTAPQARRDRRSRTARDLPFAARGGERIAGRRVLLVDDVVTTGATMTSAARALRRAGAAAVIAVAAGRTPRHDDLCVASRPASEPRE